MSRARYVRASNSAILGLEAGARSRKRRTYSVGRHRPAGIPLGVLFVCSASTPRSSQPCRVPSGLLRWRWRRRPIQPSPSRPRRPAAGGVTGDAARQDQLLDEGLDRLAGKQRRWPGRGRARSRRRGARGSPLRRDPDRARATVVDLDLAAVLAVLDDDQHRARFSAEESA